MMSCSYYFVINFSTLFQQQTISGFFFSASFTKLSPYSRHYFKKYYVSITMFTK